jgi:putative addiction module killer protein
LERLRRIEHQGNFGNCGPIGNGLQELKIDFGPGYRIYFGLDGEAIVLLLGAGDKSTQQTDIARAIKRWEEYNA